MFVCGGNAEVLAHAVLGGAGVQHDDGVGGGGGGTQLHEGEGGGIWRGTSGGLAA